MEENQEKDKVEIYSNRVRAGKRTYFFDVKSTRSNDYYLTITESKRRFKENGFTYEKHKIFLYKEDFDKFLEAVQDAIGHIKKELMPEFDFSQFDNREERNENSEGTHDTSESSESSQSSDDELKWE